MTTTHSTDVRSAALPYQVSRSQACWRNFAFAGVAVGALTVYELFTPYVMFDRHPALTVVSALFIMLGVLLLPVVLRAKPRLLTSLTDLLLTGKGDITFYVNRTTHLVDMHYTPDTATLDGYYAWSSSRAMWAWFSFGSFCLAFAAMTVAAQL